MEYVGSKKLNSSGPTNAPVKEICAGCKKMIEDKYLLRAENKYWHEDCLKCSCCECRLGEVGSSFFLKANLFLCRRDYLRLFGNTGYCTACEKVIPAFEMVMKARTNVYHLECFACQECNHRFCVGDKFYLWQNKILCERDYRTYAFDNTPNYTQNNLPAPVATPTPEPFPNKESIDSVVPSGEQRPEDAPLKNINTHYHHHKHNRTDEQGIHPKRVAHSYSSLTQPQRTYHEPTPYNNNDNSQHSNLLLDPVLRYDLGEGQEPSNLVEDEEEDDVDLFELLADSGGHSNMAPELMGNVTT